MIRPIALSVFLGGLVAAYAADEPLPKAETILDRHVEVTGGKAAYQKRKSEIATGTLKFAAQGFSNKEAATKLALSVKTVETYKARAAEKLGLRTRAEIVRYGTSRGWLERP